MSKHQTDNKSYTERLNKLSSKPWKQLFRVQAIYQRNLLKLCPGKTLDIGCGIGRYLEVLPAGSIGIDHNSHSVDYAVGRGFTAYTTKEFFKNKRHLANFDSLLLSHVLEHLTMKDSLRLLKDYQDYLKPSGKLIIFCPQERGYASDSTHVTYLNESKLIKMVKDAGFALEQSFSFPFPPVVGKLFKYNEFIIIARKL